MRNSRFGTESAPSSVDSLSSAGVATDWARASTAAADHVLEDRRHRQRGDELRREVGVANRPEGDPLGEDRDHDPGQQRPADRGGEGQPGEHVEGVGRRA